MEQSLVPTSLSMISTAVTLVATLHIEPRQDITSFTRWTRPIPWVGLGSSTEGRARICETHSIDRLVVVLVVVTVVAHLCSSWIDFAYLTVFPKKAANSSCSLEHVSQYSDRLPPTKITSSVASFSQRFNISKLFEGSNAMHVVPITHYHPTRTPHIVSNTSRCRRSGGCSGVRRSRRSVF